MESPHLVLQNFTSALKRKEKKKSHGALFFLCLMIKYWNLCKCPINSRFCYKRWLFCFSNTKITFFPSSSFLYSFAFALDLPFETLLLLSADACYHLFFPLSFRLHHSVKSCIWFPSVMSNRWYHVSSVAFEGLSKWLICLKFEPKYTIRRK